MRMDQSSSTTASKIINGYPEEELHKIFGMYGELKNAKTVAREIARQRTVKPFATTTDLKAALEKLAPRGKENKYFAQVFQALRLVVNEELRALENFLHQCAEVTAKDGRLVVMSYHSLEDRMVKNFINTGKVFGELEKDLYGNPIRPFEAVNRKVIEASEDEINNNSRARSAKLRIAVRV
jgi:16S rRNA (cytosine1402-N4)-methyltransferase